MNYYISAIKNGQPLLGTENQAIVRDAKSLVKVKNRLKYFRPGKEWDTIKVFSYTNLYDDKTHRLVREFTPEEFKRYISY